MFLVPSPEEASTVTVSLPLNSTQLDTLITDDSLNDSSDEELMLKLPWQRMRHDESDRGGNPWYLR